MEVQEQAARLAEHNAALERELKEACHSLFDAKRSIGPSTSAVSVESPVVVDLGGSGVVLTTSMDLIVGPKPLSMLLSTISLRACGTIIKEC